MCDAIDVEDKVVNDHSIGRDKLFRLGKLCSGTSRQPLVTAISSMKKEATVELLTQELKGFSEDLNNIVEIGVVVGNVAFTPERRPVSPLSCDCERCFVDDKFTAVYRCDKSTTTELMTMRMPFRCSDSWDLACCLEFSEVGIAGVGTVLDQSIRKSREGACCTDSDVAQEIERDALADVDDVSVENDDGMGVRRPSSVQLETLLEGCDPESLPMVLLPKQLRSFDFPAALARISEELCPFLQPWKRVVAKPYKFLAYCSGDSFAPHVDTLRAPTHFATLSLHIPTEVNDDLLWGDGAADLEARMELVDFLEANTSYDPITKQVTVHKNFNDDGAILFGDKDAGNNARTRTVSLLDQYRAALYHMRKFEAEKKGLPVKELLLRKESVVHLRTYPLSYAAWLTDAQHEVTTIVAPDGKSHESSARFVVTYELHQEDRPVSDTYWASSASTQRQQRLLHPGSEQQQPDPINPQHHVPISPIKAQRLQSRFEALWTRFKNNTMPKILALQGTVSPSHPVDLAFCLGHQYPLAAIRPSSLKGVDKMAYELFNLQFDTTFICAAEVQFGPAYEPGKQNVYEGNIDKLFYSRMVVAAKADELPHNIGREELPTRDYLINCLWIDLGSGGQVYQGGSIMGNHDCGVDWYYRMGVMVVHLNRDSIARRRCITRWWLNDAMPRLAAVEDIVGEILLFAS